jgi:hypothetical protein
MLRSAHARTRTRVQSDDRCMRSHVRMIGWDRYKSFLIRSGPPRLPRRSHRRLVDLPFAALMHIVQYSRYTEFRRSVSALRVRRPRWISCAQRIRQRAPRASTRRIHPPGCGLAARARTHVRAPSFAHAHAPHTSLRCARAYCTHARVDAHVARTSACSSSHVHARVRCCGYATSDRAASPDHAPSRQRRAISAQPARAARTAHRRCPRPGPQLPRRLSAGQESGSDTVIRMADAFIKPRARQPMQLVFIHERDQTD